MSGPTIRCSTPEELRAYDDGVICWVDISSSGFLLDEYKEFCNSEDYNSDYNIERLGKDEWKRILSIAKKRHWQPDRWLSCAISDSSVALLVSVADKRISIETGCVGGESERSSASFEEGHLSGMPEIEEMIKKSLSSFLIRSTKGQHARTRLAPARTKSRR